MDRQLSTSVKAQINGITHHKEAYFEDVVNLWNRVHWCARLGSSRRVSFGPAIHGDKTF